MRFSPPCTIAGSKIRTDPGSAAPTGQHCPSRVGSGRPGKVRGGEGKRSGRWGEERSTVARVLVIYPSVAIIGNSSWNGEGFLRVWQMWQQQIDEQNLKPSNLSV